MTQECVHPKKILRLDSEGVGRSNLSKAHSDTDCSIENIAAGVHSPQSGRKDIHPAVVEVARKKYGIDISSWPVNQLKPEMIDQDVIVLALLTEIEQIPAYVYRQAFDVLLAPIQDPADDIDNKLEHTATQICYINLLLDYVLTHHMDMLGTHRDKNGDIIPRTLFQFDPEFDPAYSTRERLIPGAIFTGARSRWCDIACSQPLRLDDWGEGSLARRLRFPF